MLNKNNLGLAALTSAEESRYAIGGILIAPDRTAATDGHMCAVISTPNLPADSVPLIPGFAPTVDFQPFILPRADAIEIGKAIPRKSTIPILSNAFVDAGANGNARIAVTNLDSSRVFEIKKTAGQFPNLDMVIPKVDEAEISIALNPGYLCTLLKTLAPVSDESQPVFILRIKDPETQIRVDVANSETGQTGIGVLMPVKAAGTHGIKPRKLTVEVESGRVRNIWTDDSLEVQVIRRNGVEIKGAELWGKTDLAPNRDIPADILAYLAPKVEPEALAAEPPEGAEAPDPAAAEAMALQPEASPAPVPSEGSLEQVGSGPEAFWARTRAEAAAVRIAALDAALEPAEQPEVQLEAPKACTEPAAEGIEPPREGATRYWVEIEGRKIAADYGPDYIGFGHIHVEFRTAGPNPISETGYRSHFFSEALGQDVQAGLQKIAEAIAEEQKAKARRRPKGKRPASPAPAAPEAPTPVATPPVSSNGSTSGEPRQAPEASKPAPPARGKRTPEATTPRPAPKASNANGWDDPAVRAKRIAAIRAARAAKVAAA